MAKNPKSITTPEEYLSVNRVDALSAVSTWVADHISNPMDAEFTATLQTLKELVNDMTNARNNAKQEAAKRVLEETNRKLAEEAFERRVKALMDEGFTEAEAEQHASNGKGVRKESTRVPCPGTLANGQKCLTTRHDKNFKTCDVYIAKLAEAAAKAA